MTYAGADCAESGPWAPSVHDALGVSSLALFLPPLLYFGYTLRVLPGLRVMKHAFRGLSYARVGRHRRALQAFRRALQLDPNNKLARDGFWDVGREVAIGSADYQAIFGEVRTAELLDETPRPGDHCRTSQCDEPADHCGIDVG